MKTTLISFLIEMFSEQDASGASHASSKRVMGAIVVIIAMVCTIYLTLTEGGTDVVEGLLQTAMVIGASLLGIASVTGIWKRGQISANHQETTPLPPPKKYCEHCGQEMPK